MKNIIPFKKDVIFKTNLSEITSISLENTLSLNEDKISGDFIINGEYKISDNSTTVEPFEIKLPFEIVMDERYDVSKAIIDIDDFYYEILNNNVLSVSIDVLVDKLQEKQELEDEILIDETPTREILQIDEEVKEDIEEEIKEVKEVKEEPVRNEESEVVEEKINSIFNQFSKDSEVYVTYNVFILRQGDTLDSIMEKYNVTEEELKKYNDLSNLQLGDKIIVPNTYETN